MARKAQRRSGVQRGVGVALWRQIADDIRAGIAADLADGAGRLPPESELAQRFGVNRHTVRAAIAALAHEGVLHSMQGRGTYVQRRARLVYPIGARTRFSAGLEGQARDRQSELLGQAESLADHDIADLLAIKPGEPVVTLDTVGRADGVPVSRATSWFSAERVPAIAEIYKQTGSMTATLAKLGIDDYVRAWTRVEARHADEADTRDLQLSAGAIVIVTRALNVDHAGLPVHYSVSRFPADRVELTIDGPKTG